MSASIVVLTILFAVKGLLGAVFTTAALVKLLAPLRFVGDVQKYGVLPRLLGPSAAWTLMCGELVVGVGLLFGYQTRFLALVTLFLLTFFLVMAGSVIIRKGNVPCICFGLLYRERIGWRTQTRDSFLLALSGSVYLWGSDLPTIGTLIARPTVRSSFGILYTLLMLSTALGLGWVASKGWPRWIIALLAHRGSSARV